jgi:hypothetical protein
MRFQIATLVALVASSGVFAAPIDVRGIGGILPEPQGFGLGPGGVLPGHSLGIHDFGPDMSLETRGSKYARDEPKSVLGKVHKTIEDIKTGKVGNLPEWEDWFLGKDKPTDW